MFNVTQSSLGNKSHGMTFRATEENTSISQEAE